MSMQQETVSASNVQSPIFQSRWGYHSISFEQYIVLRELHKQVWNEYRALCYIHRQLQKHPLNRMGHLPDVDELEFIEPAKTICKFPHYRSFFDGEMWVTYRDSVEVYKEGKPEQHYTMTPIAVAIVDGFRTLSKPAETPEAVPQIDPALLAFIKKTDVKWTEWDKTQKVA